MSISGISSSNFFQPHNSGTPSTLRRQFQQLGQDLQSGNLTQAQSDFATLEQNLPGAHSPTATATGASTLAVSSTNTNPITQAISQLSQDLQSGNLSAAQSDFANLQKDVQQTATQGHPHHHHHHSAGESQNSNSDAAGTAIKQSFAALGQALQTGNLQAAQQSYTSLQQELSQISGLSAITSANTGSIPASAAQGTVNLTA